MRVVNYRRLLGIAAIGAVLWIAYESMPSSADSTMTQVTKTNVEDHAFAFRVIPEDKDDGLIWFRVAVSPKQDRERWCTSAIVQVVKGQQEVGSFKIVAGSSGCADSSESEGRWIYAFTISREYLKESRFTFFDSHCSMPSFDGYWMSLEEFYKQ